MLRRLSPFRPMRALRSPLAISVAVLIGIGLLLRAHLPPAPPPAPAGFDVQDIQKAEGAMAQNKYDEALKLAQEIPRNYPTSALIPGSYLIASACYFYLKDYDKAVETADK